MEAKKKPAKNHKTERSITDFVVGDRVKVNMHRGRIIDATVKAIIDRTDGKRLQVDFGKDATALIHLWQVVRRK
jgi:molybdopterin-binding protein